MERDKSKVGKWGGNRKITNSWGSTRRSFGETQQTQKEGAEGRGQSAEGHSGLGKWDVKASACDKEPLCEMQLAGVRKVRYS